MEYGVGAQSRARSLPIVHRGKAVGMRPLDEAAMTGFVST